MKIDVKSFLDKKYDKLKEITLTLTPLSEKPKLVTFLIGDKKDSETYVRNKEKSIEKAGMQSETIKIPDGTPIAEIYKQVSEINEKNNVHGILIQLPLNRKYYTKEDENLLINCLNPLKDVDGLCMTNQAKLFMGENQEKFLTPCTPTGIVQLLKEHIGKHRETGIVGLNAIVVGRSQLLGNSLAQMLMREDANVTILHSKSLIHFKPKTLGSYLLDHNADIICLCAGSPNILTAKDLDPNGRDITIIDAAINIGEDGKLRGDLCKEDYPQFDVDFGECYIHYTSVPGGVGPITTYTLAYNLYKAYCLQNNIKIENI